MKIIGKLLGAVIGWIIAGPIGIVIGIMAGHFFDLGHADNLLARKRKRLIQAQHIFFQSTFAVMGYLAKVDGRVSEKEIHAAQTIMRRLGLTSSQKIRAIQFFNYGKSPSFQFDHQLGLFDEMCGDQPNLVRLFIEIQFKNASADNFENQYKQYALERICEKLHLSKEILKQLRSQFQSENSMHEKKPRPRDELAHAYLVLGIDKAVDNQRVKRAYKQLVSQNHPDKLVAKGLPEEMIKLATEKMQSIQKAYELICRMRGMK